MYLENKRIRNTKMFHNHRWLKCKKLNFKYETQILFFFSNLKLNHIYCFFFPIFISFHRILILLRIGLIKVDIGACTLQVRDNKDMHKAHFLIIIEA